MRKFSFQSLLSQITALSVGVALTILLGFAFRAVGAGGCINPTGAGWSGPTSTPPNNNVCPPINASNVSQSKGGEPIASLLDINGALSSQVLQVFGTKDNNGGQSVVQSSLKVAGIGGNKPEFFVTALGESVDPGSKVAVCVEGKTGRFVLCDDDGGGNPPPPPPGGDPAVNLTVNGVKSTTITTTQLTQISSSINVGWTTSNLDKSGDKCVASSDNNAANWNGTTQVGLPNGSSNTPLVKKYGVTTFTITCTQASSGKTATSSATVKAGGSYAYSSIFSKNFLITM